MVNKEYTKEDLLKAVEGLLDPSTQPREFKIQIQGLFEVLIEKIFDDKK